jgi:protein TonB
MALRCLLFCSDEGTAAPLREVLAGLGVEGKHCSEAVLAVEEVSNQPFQIVIIDWDLQPEAGMLLTAARERKASERPLTLAIVSDELSVPKALQAGANSILRKPILPNQAKDTLKTARDLLRARQDSAANAANAATAAQSAAAAAAAGGPTASGSTLSGSTLSGPTLSRPVATAMPGYAAQTGENPLRAGEFVQSGGQAPGRHFDTESEMQKSMAHAAAAEVDPLQELEPMAAAVQTEPQATTSPAEPADGRPRGLEWYLKRAGVAPAGPVAAAAPPAPAPAPAKPDLIGFDQTPSYSEPAEADTVEAGSLRPAPARASGLPKSLPRGLPKNEPRGEQETDEHGEHKEQKREAELFAYIDGAKADGVDEPAGEPQPGFRLGRGAIGWALALAACAVVAAPQAPWHPQVRAAWARGQRVVHGWLNPQLVTTPQAPPSHESFGRAGDEYKLPVAETIPDATTDPSQIRVTPVIDPTAKKPNDGTNSNQTATPDGASPPAATTGTPATPADPFQTPAGTAPGTQGPTNAPAGNPTNGPGTSTAAPGTTASPATTPATTPNSTASSPTVVAAPVTSAPASLQQPIPQRNAQVVVPSTVSGSAGASMPTSSGIPSSLQSQIASSTPDASGNKAPEAAMNAIEPVAIPEATERALLTEQPAVSYPASAKGQQGTVTLQVLVGRDGSVQDAKFMQGSLAFARAAIDGVKLWKFKPYMMNGRAVSVQVPMTISFKPGQ